MKLTTACPLDCYDACEIGYEDGLLKGLKRGHTQGFLCSHLNHYNEFKTILRPRYKGVEITLDEALLKLKEMLKNSKKDKILHYRGSGNFGLMQEVTDHFFSSFGATLTDGTLCDGAGEAGIIAGRGGNKNMPPSEIAKSDVVIVWGRNPHATSSHLLPLLKNKKIIVIDPVKTQIAKMADLYIQIKPHADLSLAMLLTDFLHNELTQTLKIKATLDEIDVTLGDIGKILELVKGQKVAIICGVGVQKYSDGADVLRAIDGFGVALGLFSKEGCGVAYLGNSKEGISSPFNTKTKRISKVDSEFSNYTTLFIQGANPLSQMPNSLRVKSSISKVENIIYFGLYENETSLIADLIIPAKSFLYKNDVRTSYSNNSMMFMNKVAETQYGISEYDLSSYLCKEFDIKLESEEFYLNHFKQFAFQKKDGSWHVQGREDRAYKNGFDTETKQFLFLEEFEKKSVSSNDFYLITPKSMRSLNSQFKREKYVYLHPALGFREDENVSISSACGTVTLKVKLDSDLREDCVLIYSGTKGVNNLTSSKHSLAGKSAIYQENRVKLKQEELNYE